MDKQYFFNENGVAASAMSSFVHHDDFKMYLSLWCLLIDV